MTIYTPIRVGTVMSAAWMPSQHATGRVSRRIELAEYPTLPLVRSLTKRFNRPSRRSTNDRLDLSRCLASQQLRIRKDIVNRI